MNGKFVLEVGNDPFSKVKKRKKGEKKCWCGDFRCTHLRTPAGITYDKSK